jgi:flagellar biosynthesis protein FlhF
LIVKRFKAESIPEAVSLVKNHFGSNAIILETRKVRKRGVFGRFRRPLYEVLAAEETPVAKPYEQDKKAAPDADLSQIQADIAEIKVNVCQNFKHGGEKLSHLFKTAYHYLVEQDLEPDLAEQLIGEIQRKAKSENAPLDVEWVKKALHETIATSIKCVDPSTIGEKSAVIPMIGPTGVGKTTTIAKLTANFAMLAKKKVGIVTADTYRIAAVEQLKTYADLIGVPLMVVYTPDDMKKAVQTFQDKDLILIDTAGRSQKHSLQMKELKALLDVLDHPETHLVVSATTRSKELINIADRFEIISYDNIIVSKIDEAISYGCIYNLGYHTNKTVTYLTNGQNVPDDIEVAEPNRIADLIMGGRFAWTKHKG